MKQYLFSFLLFTLLAFSGQSFAQTKHFKGNWTKIGTAYDFQFDLYLEFRGGNRVEGVFHWELVSYDQNDPWGREYYKDKTGATAKEYVRGVYNPQMRQYFLKGYKKDDPDLIIALDEYRITEDENGDIGGDTSAHNSWNGRINGKGVRPDQV